MNSELWILSKVMDFYPLLKNMGKRLSCKYGQKCPNSTKKAAIDRLKTASKTSIQKTLDPTDDLVPNKIVEKITKAALKNTFEDSSNSPISILFGQPKEKGHPKNRTNS